MAKPNYSYEKRQKEIAKKKKKEEKRLSKLAKTTAGEQAPADENTEAVDLDATAVDTTDVGATTDTSD